MSKRIMTKLKSFIIILTIVLAISSNFSAANLTSESNSLENCMAVESSLPMNHSNHPCAATHMPNQSWLSWLKNDRKSAHLHFLDLVELLHYSFR